jgi:LmbE family N-acetylglucosaminyl deacetylase
VALATDLCADANVVVTNDRTAGGADASDLYPVADTPITFVARDPSGNESSIVAVVRVIDDSPPEFTAVSADPATLWPPNHRMVSVVINAAVEDNCAPAPAVRILAVASNEADDALGDGSTTPDYTLDPAHPNVVQLRAERSGLGVGRVYTITLEAMDLHGNVATTTVAVPVAHDRGTTG